MPRSGISAWMDETDEYVIRHVYALENAAINQLYVQYRYAFARIRAEAERLFARQGTDAAEIADPFRMRRNAILNAQIAAELVNLADIGDHLTLDAAIDAYRAFYYGRAWQMDVLTGGKINYPLLPVEMIRAQVLTPYKGQTFIDRFKDHRDEFVMRIQGAVVQSQIEGLGIREMAREIALNMGVVPGQSTSAANSRNIGLFQRATMIARTETIRSSALGAVAIYERNKDVLKGWVIRSALDDRVCPICAPLDGEEVLFTDKSKRLPPFHVQCRCNIVPLLRNEAIERELRGRRPTFTEWAQARGVTTNQYGQAYNLRAVPPPQSPGATR